MGFCRSSWVLRQSLSIQVCPGLYHSFLLLLDSLISSHHFERCLSLDIKLYGNLDLETCPLMKAQTSSKAIQTGPWPTVPGASEDQSYLNHSAHKESSVCLLQMARVTVWFCWCVYHLAPGSPLIDGANLNTGDIFQVYDLKLRTLFFLTQWKNPF